MEREGADTGLRDTGDTVLGESLREERVASVLKSQLWDMIRNYKNLTRNLRSKNRELRHTEGGLYWDRSWRNTFIKLYYRLPESIRTLACRKHGTKKQIKEWIKGNVEQKLL